MGQGFTIYMALACGMVIFGPTLGGIVMKVIGTASAWRIVMWICVALCVISFLICFAKVKDNPNIPKGSMKGFDWAGAVFVLLMFGALVCVPTFGQQNGWVSAATLASIGVAVVGLIVLFLVEKKASNPILNGKFMARKNFVLPVLIMFLTQGLMTACLTEIIRFGYAIDKATVAAVAMSIEYLGMAIGTGKDEASGSPFINSFPEKLISTFPFGIGEVINESCFSAVTPVSGWNQCV